MTEDCRIITRYSNLFSIFKSTPDQTIVRRAVFMPLRKNPPENDQSWGLYSEDGLLIPSGAFSRGPIRRTVGQTMYHDFTDVKIANAPPANYLYGGFIISHYGHFLLTTLSRLWLGVDRRLSDYKIVCHGAGRPASWFKRSFMRDIFESLGLSEDHFVTFDKPTLIPDILVPHICFREHYYAHKVFSELGNHIGNRLTETAQYPAHSAPVYFSKHKLTHGVQGLVNEEDLCERLERAGVKILFPEQMSIIEQVSIFQTAPAVMACVGSSLHTSILAAPGTKLVCLSLVDVINSNYGLIDRVNGNDAAYLFSGVDKLAKSDTSRFDVQLRLRNPVAVAEAMLRAISAPKTAARAFSPVVNAAINRQNAQLLTFEKQEDEPYKPIDDRDASFIPIRMGAHISFIGDRESNLGYITKLPGRRQFQDEYIQGFWINKFCAEEFDLWYRAKLDDESWTRWVGHGEYVGTRGKNKGLRGFAVRLGDRFKSDLDLKIIGKFQLRASPLTVADGSDCTAGQSDGFLSGMQLILRTRSNF